MLKVSFMKFLSIMPFCGGCSFAVELLIKTAFHKFFDILE